MTSIHPAYTGVFSSEPDNFQQCCQDVLNLFDHSDKILRASRNTLKQLEFNNESCVLKAFKVPSFPQNITYGLFSNSKAKKSYLNGNKLLKLGFLTPKPTGYFEHRKGGKLIHSYYLCAHTAAPTLDEHIKGLQEIPDDLITDFAQLCVDLHVKGVFHRDYNPLNILVEQEASSYNFSLVDINRISWYDTLNLEQSMQSMSRLYFPEGIEERIITKYAELRNLAPSSCKASLEKEKLKTKQYFRNKKKLRKIFPKK